ncbi:GGDEF domain-containing protein [Halopseudomonas phragmitis]|uniref:diguanylate cyclase n=1 Tax=Halopseudomonas phragmitis TaxID=1931241 RepID=A0A1V0B7D4_9GAMM|nr:GGDEF domain-containing protein [Halopseudomonas phragmitis]AQZ95827.1 GGDEF domain-containing protein [Halopseudomonas phragmitis]
MAKLWLRLKGDFQLSIITLVGLVALLGVTPYAIFRLIEGSWLVGIVDSLLVLCTLVAIAYAWRTGNTIRPGQFLATIYSIGAVLVSIKLGVNGLFWFYNLILFNFFVVPPRQSLVATLSALAVLCLYGLLNPGEVFESYYQMSSFLVTCLMASLFAFVFAYRGRRQREQLNTLATIDPLTGAGNRRTMEQELVIAMSARQRYAQAYGLLVLDLDNFKQINDRHGHKAGDQVLVDFVRIVKAVCRKSDRLFRLGGEEFVLLLPGIDAKGLFKAAEHLRARIAAELSSPGGGVTVSIGGALLTDQASWEVWLQQADENLYRAKREGRNRVCLPLEVQTQTIQG